MNKTVLGIFAFIASMIAITYIALGLPTTVSIPRNIPSTETSFNLSEIAQHKTESNCWMTINGNVYDVSNYATEHPGGRMDLLAGCGIDATELYTSGKAGRHHQRAVAILESYKIGVLTN